LRQDPQQRLREVHRPEPQARDRPRPDQVRGLLRLQAPRPNIKARAPRTTQTVPPRRAEALVRRHDAQALRQHRTESRRGHDRQGARRAEEAPQGQLRRRLVHPGPDPAATEPVREDRPRHHCSPHHNELPGPRPGPEHLHPRRRHPCLPVRRHHR
ncbi:hypothetical protein LTR16_011808, partial [Cryomyces antarcticus]